MMMFMNNIKNLLFFIKWYIFWIYAATLDKSFSLRWDDINERLIVDGNIYREQRKDNDYGTYGSADRDGIGRDGMHM